MRLWLTVSIFAIFIPQCSGFTELLSPIQLKLEAAIYKSQIETLQFVPKVTEYQIPMTLSQKIKIAIVDTGVDFSHPLLAPFESQMHKKIPSMDFHGHGTHVAGIIAHHLNQIYGKQAPELFEFASFPYVLGGDNMKSYNDAIRS